MHFRKFQPDTTLILKTIHQTVAGRTALPLAARVVLGATASALTLGTFAGTPGQTVNTSATFDNSTIKITYGSYSGNPAAAPVGVYGIAYITPDANWAVNGGVDVTFQIFNPGGLAAGSTPFEKKGVGIGFQLTPHTGYIATTSLNLASVLVPTVGTVTATKTFAVGGEYPTGGSIPSGDSWNYLADSTANLSAPSTPSTGGGDIITFVVKPTVAGNRIWVSDFYNTPVGANALVSEFHLQGIFSALSSIIGAKATDVIYLTPEPSTWAGGFTLVAAAVGWGLRSKFRRTA